MIAHMQTSQYPRLPFTTRPRSAQVDLKIRIWELVAEVDGVVKRRSIQILLQAMAGNWQKKELNCNTQAGRGAYVGHSGIDS